ncbi:LpqB family beta-propeller domain-containing protein [Geodermatophilus sp. SYSU D00815]
MRRLLGVLTAVLAVAGCSTVPTSSPTVQITQAPDQPDETVGIEPVPPEPGATPEEVVSGFIDAAASTTRGHPVAREHLTGEAAETWSDETGITVLSQDYSAVTTSVGTIRVTAGLVGTVDPRGVFTVGDQESFAREFTLQQVDGEWRIADPPDGLLMLEPDFARLYDELPAYFLDPTGQRLVPDPRYLVSGDAQPTTLVDRLLEGPSAALTAGVRNPLAGARLREAVTVSEQTFTVNLTNVSRDSPQLGEICAQLVWTLEPFSARNVRILVDGEPLVIEGVSPVQTVDDWARFDPDGVAVDAAGHYLSNGALYTVTGRAAPGPAGAGAYGLTSAAVSADPRTGELVSMAGVTGAGGGQSLLTGGYGGDLAPTLTAGTLSVPTVAATRAEFWVVRDGEAVVRVPAQGPPQAVSTPTLPGLGRTEELQLSPDGVRAAVVVDGPEGPRIYVGTVVRSENGAVALPDLREIAPSLGQVVDVAWRDAGSLVVLAGDAGGDRIEPYTVGVDGWGLDDVGTAGLPAQPTSVAAAPSRSPLVSAGDTIWQLSGGTWVTLIRGEEPLPGTEPFYPL